MHLEVEIMLLHLNIFVLSGYEPKLSCAQTNKTCNKIRPFFCSSPPPDTHTLRGGNHVVVIFIYTISVIRVCPLFFTHSQLSCISHATVLEGFLIFYKNNISKPKHPNSTDCILTHSQLASTSHVTISENMFPFCKTPFKTGPN